MSDSKIIKSLAGSLIWELSKELNSYVGNEASCYRNSVHIKDISENLDWLSAIHLDDWDYGNGFLAIYEEITAKHTWLLSGLRLWNRFCEEVALQADHPVNYGVCVVDSSVGFKGARDRWQSLGYEYQYIKPIKGIKGLLNPNSFKLSDATR